MSVRISGTTDRAACYGVTNGLPTGNSWTLMGWVKIVADRNTYSTPFSLDTLNYGTGTWTLQTQADGTSYYLWDEPGNADMPGPNAVVGDWYAFACIKNGTSGTFLYKAEGGSTTVVTGTVANFTPTHFRIGTSSLPSGETIDGSMSNIKLYGAALTQSEAEAEWESWDLVRTADIIRHHRFRDSVSTADDSGNGNTLNSASAASYDADNPDIGSVPQVTVQTELELVGAGAWVTGTTSVAPGYPTGLLEYDICYLIVHNKPDTVTPATPADWTLAFTVTGGGGSQASGTGITRITVFKRVVPAGGLSGTQSVTITSGNVSQAHIRAYRPKAGQDSEVTYTEQLGYFSKTTASTSLAHTTNVGTLAILGPERLAVVVGVPDDTSPTLTSVTSSGVTFGSLTRTPDATSITTTNNDIGAVAYDIEAIGGSGSHITTEGSLPASETGIIVALAVRGKVPVPPAQFFELLGAA